MCVVMWEMVWVICDQVGSGVRVCIHVGIGVSSSRSWCIMCVPWFGVGDLGVVVDL